MLLNRILLSPGNVPSECLPGGVTVSKIRTFSNNDLHPHSNNSLYFSLACSNIFLIFPVKNIRHSTRREKKRHKQNKIDADPGLRQKSAF